MRHTNELVAKARTHSVEPIDLVRNDWRVESGTSGRLYVVKLGREATDGQTFVSARCTCEWGSYRKSADGFRCACSHTIAVYAMVYAEALGGVTRAWASLEAALRQHRPTVALGDGVWLTVRTSDQTPSPKTTPRKRTRSAAAIALWGTEAELDGSLI